MRILFVFAIAFALSLAQGQCRDAAEYCAETIDAQIAMVASAIGDGGFLESLEPYCRPALCVWVSESSAVRVDLNVVNLATGAIDHRTTFSVDYGSVSNASLWRDLSKLRIDIACFRRERAADIAAGILRLSVCVQFNRVPTPQKGWSSAGPNYPKLTPWAIERVGASVVFRAASLSMRARTVGVTVPVP